MADLNQAYIVSSCRSAIGTFLGGLSSFTGTQLGALAVREAVKRAGVNPDEVDEVIMGQVVQAGVGQAPARQAQIHGGVNPQAGAMTINKVCGSGLKAVTLATQAIRLGDSDCIIAGGMESMSGTPYVVHGAKTGFKFGDRGGSRTLSTPSSSRIDRNTSLNFESRSMIRKRLPLRKPSSQSVRFLAICFIHGSSGFVVHPAK